MEELELEYPVCAFPVTSNGRLFWMASCPELNGCVGQGETLDEAMSELRINEKVWLEAAREFAIEIPEVPIIDLDRGTSIRGYKSKQ